MQLRMDDLRAWFDPFTLERGRALQRTHGVLDFSLGSDGQTAIGEVRGQVEERYRAFARIERDHDGQATLHDGCSCYLGGRCKHVVALLLQLLASGTDSRAPAAGGAPSRSAAVEGWLRKLGVATLPVLGVDTEAGFAEHVLYLLDHDEQAVTVRSVVARRLKKGGYGRPRAYDPRTVLQYGQAAFLAAQDRVLLRELALAGDVDAEPASGPVRVLAGESGSALLERLLATGRCHWRNEAGAALALGEVRPAEPRWSVDDHGQSRLVLVATPPAAAVLALAPPWYVDAAACGPLDTGLEPRLAEALAASPLLAPEELGPVWDWLARHLPGQRLPSPPALDVERVDDYRPQPRLTLYTCEVAAAPAAVGRGLRAPLQVDGLRLEFVYGDNVLGRDDPATVISQREAGKVRRLVRAGAFEHDCLARLERADFVPVRDLPGGERLPRECRRDFGQRQSDAWVDFVMDEVPQLRAEGWDVRIEPGFRFHLVEAGEWYAELDEGGQDWFGLALGVEVDGQPVNLLPCLVELIAALPGGSARGWLEGLGATRKVMVPLPGGRLLPVPAERIRGVLAVLIELYDSEGLNLRGEFVLPRSQVSRLDELEAALGGPRRLVWRGGERLRALAARLRSGPQPVALPEGFHAQLRPYQQEGLAWLQFLREAGVGGVLADDMGLGKTVQALAHLQAEKRAGRLDLPCLIVSPTSLLANWRDEAARFAPELRVLGLRGPERAADFARIGAHDLVLTTYALLPRDREVLAAQRWHLLILDEAQAIKNPLAQAGIVVRGLDARHRLCLTGTPMENHLGELWSLFDFLMPGFLGDARQFQRLFRKPIENHGDAERCERLRRRVAPFMLRRTKDQVALDLPPKTEVDLAVELAGPQRDLYESIRLALQARVRAEIAAKGLARSHIVILDALLKLRQVCCDPRLVKLETARQAKVSAKLDMLMEMLPELVEEGRRILVFSQFTTMLGLIEKALDKVPLRYVKLTGSTEDREAPVRSFQAGEAPIFLISLKAGGTGLNLTAADTVIHYDPWWNPAVEDQATDRAHRIGQDKPVFVYRLFTEGTVEEKIRALQARKRLLVDGVLREGHGAGVPWTDAELEDLFAPLA
ncbi:helicase-like protein [Plasticicumulans lactativorans]|uniref:Helicase-like protein n=1 Tax=Plasticicumulans lactativorans TaxID=1133106 RepID=A0A4R2L8S4_9GAMM|nr:DEAD/DEAH box helicase [Plasticicumulans lactativorans]TCO81716.1 helicase-like protein [Plasticicumulans lactativorans]